MQILVLATDYPRPDGYVSCYFIHTRNKYYVQKGIDVSVLSFRAKNDYILDGVKVYTLGTYEDKLINYQYDLLVSHAPNLKNHYKFLRKYGNKFKNIVFFFHGHEILISSKIYPAPYNYVKKAPFINNIIREIYDRIKLVTWKKYFEKIAYKSQFVFVSNWMYNMFMRFVKIDSYIIQERKHIIYNSVGEIFEKMCYNPELTKEYDFITIRSNLDGSKYAIDIVTKIAQNNPQFKFCVVGKGDFYKFNKRPENLVWIDKHLSHEEIVDYLNKSKCALMPTRADAQGVMMCEMATFGIPVITSNIEVCKEIFVDFDNVGYIYNDAFNIDIEPIFNMLTNVHIKEKNTKYFAENTISKEVELFNKLI